MQYRQTQSITAPSDISHEKTRNRNKPIKPSQNILFTSFIFSFNLLKIAKLRVSGKKKNFKGTRLILLPKTDLTFSFFSTIYLGETVSEENKASIIAHEKVHIQQKHSYDLLYFELLRIVFWFNPLVYMFQNRIATLHEYIADSEILSKPSFRNISNRANFICQYIF